MHVIEQAKKAAVLACARNAEAAGRWKLLKARFFGRRRRICVDGEGHVVARWGGQWFWLYSREIS